MKLVRLAIAMVFACFAQISDAQTTVEMADTLRSEGKIYVVVAIILVIFIGIAAYLFSIQRKVTRLEKKFPDKKG